MTGQPLGLTLPLRRASMRGMGRTRRTLAAALAGLALVAALPGPCACGPERMASRHADEHACCAPPVGVRAADRGCCDEAPATASAVPSPAGPAAGTPVAIAALRIETPVGLRALPEPAASFAPSPPPTVLRI